MLKASVPRVLVLARNYPNNAMPLLGLWTRRLVHAVTESAEVKVLAPVPYAPRLVARVAPYYARYREVVPHWWDGPVEVIHPKLLVGPGQWLYTLEALSYIGAVLPVVRRLRHNFPFDLIHAHFTYPDGVVASLLGRLYGVPVVITEHSLWLPWIRQYPNVQWQAARASGACDAHIAVSRAVRRHIGEVTGDPGKVQVIPNAVDGEVFRAQPGQQRVAGQILFVGIVREAKGVDVLLRAICELRRQRPGVRLVMVGEPFYRAYMQEAERLTRLINDLGLVDCITVLGKQSPGRVAQLMSESQIVVLPSRRESFGTVLIEALACGTPVVATRCGGPEDIVGPEVGYLVPPDDAPALARALKAVLDDTGAYAPDVLRQYALARFGAPAVGQQLAAQYARVLGLYDARTPHQERPARTSSPHPQPRPTPAKATRGGPRLSSTGDREWS